MKRVYSWLNSVYIAGLHMAFSCSVPCWTSGLDWPIRGLWLAHDICCGMMSAYDAFVHAEPHQRFRTHSVVRISRKRTLSISADLHHEMIGKSTCHGGVSQYPPEVHMLTPWCLHSTASEKLNTAVAFVCSTARSRVVEAVSLWRPLFDFWRNRLSQTSNRVFFLFRELIQNERALRRDVLVLQVIESLVCNLYI